MWSVFQYYVEKIRNQNYNIIDKNSNISLFHNLFDIKDGEDCINDIMNFYMR